MNLINVNLNIGWKQITIKILDYWRLPKGKFIVKFKKNDGLDDDYVMKNTLPSHLGAFILSNSKKIFNDFTRELHGFYNNKNILRRY